MGRARVGAVAYRKQLHQQLGLSEERPQFRRGNRHRFAGDAASGRRPLLNTHVGLSRPAAFPEVALVHGRYAYHHYMQVHTAKAPRPTFGGPRTPSPLLLDIHQLWVRLRVCWFVEDRTTSTTTAGAAPTGRCRRSVRGSCCRATWRRPCRATARSSSASSASATSRRRSPARASGSAPWRFASLVRLVTAATMACFTR